MTRSGQSTAPAASTQGADGRSLLGIAWVAPSERFLALETQGDRCLLGRGDDADFTVGGFEASRHHAEIRRDGPVILIRDLASTNGTFVNGQRTGQASLGPRTVLRIGDSVGVVVERFETESDNAPFKEIAQGFWGGPTLCHVLVPLVRCAPGDLPIVIQGETGCGKERVARLIHEKSERRGPFVALNCAALPESLAEAELFGYRKGAFTGAERPSVGHFRAADGGTLLLDEILDLPLPVQAKLLRALEQREVMPLGDAATVKVDVRIVAATQAPLADAVKAGRFRGDLYARLDGLTLRLPPLRDRPEDVAPLFRRFLFERSGGHPPEVEARLVETLCLYDWPFNVRELELVARRLLTLSGHEPVLGRTHLPERVLRARVATTGDITEASAGEDEVARLLSALRANGGVVARAAQAIGISRPRAYRLMAEHDLDPDAFRTGTPEAVR